MVNRLPDLERLEDEELLRRGIAAARVDEDDEARAFLEELTRREPEQADAWLWLGSVAATPQERRDAFERVLQLRPEDEDAAAGLERLAAKYGRGLLEDRDLDLETLHCTWHPERETLLRCSRCGRPMCPDCARQHPVGLRCKQCMRELRSPLYKVGPAQLAGGLVSGLIAWSLAALAMAYLPLGLFFGLLIAFAAGPIAADAISRGAGRKRGRGVQVVTLLSLVLALVLLWGLYLTGILPLLPPSPMESLILLGLGGVGAWRRLE